eukprot:2452662-Rhodomonas_salina.1
MCIRDSLSPCPRSLSCVAFHPILSHTSPHHTLHLPSSTFRSLTPSLAGWLAGVRGAGRSGRGSSGARAALLRGAPGARGRRGSPPQ